MSGHGHVQGRAAAEPYIQGKGILYLMWNQYITRLKYVQAATGSLSGIHGYFYKMLFVAFVYHSSCQK